MILHEKKYDANIQICIFPSLLSIVYNSVQLVSRPGSPPLAWIEVWLENTFLNTNPI